MSIVTCDSECEGTVVGMSGAGNEIVALGCHRPPKPSAASDSSVVHLTTRPYLVQPDARKSWKKSGWVAKPLTSAATAWKRTNSPTIRPGWISFQRSWNWS